MVGHQIMAQLELVDRQGCLSRAPKFVDGASRTVYNEEGYGGNVKT